MRNRRRNKYEAISNVFLSARFIYINLCNYAYEYKPRPLIKYYELRYKSHLSLYKNIHTDKIIKYIDCESFL